MKGILLVLLIVFITAKPCLCARVRPRVDSSFDVVSYGAVGDGQTDDSQAFKKAWQDVCGATQDTPTLLIPEGKTFMLQPVSFKGPCKSDTINIEFHGTIIAPKSVDAWKWGGDSRGAWLQFWGISDLVIQGGGTIDGQGAAWWNQYSKDEENDGLNRPTALKFIGCKNLSLKNSTHTNSPRNHISITSCSDSTISNIHIVAPEESPNTDGIDISRSSNILIENSKIETGDDCIAINNGSTFINITSVTCGPGHGISVGSLGRNGKYETVEEIYVHNCTLQGTQNGARIKTWMGGSGYARKITFEDIILVGARNPVIIDQHYKDIIYNGLNKAMEVSDITYKNVRGTSASEDSIILDCDAEVGCTNIVFHDINITSATGGETHVSCNFASGTCSSCYPNVTCLSSP